jgi:ParB family transcriptional regulator, chromosome partitioning protein
MKRNRKIKTIPIAEIKVLNSRDRRAAPFKEMVSSVARLGLKKPITVSSRNGDAPYELACGQGRIEAFLALGQKNIPAIVVDASTEDCILMSLVENIARRRHSPLEYLAEIGRLAKHYSTNEIAGKLDLKPEHVRAIGLLLKRGEERLLSAVERGVIPPTLAIEIAKAKSPKLQGALLETYASQRSTSAQVAKIRRLAEQRYRGTDKAREREGKISAASLVRAYRQETQRQKLVTSRADLAQARLLFIVNALRTLLSERMFVTILREESLDTLPLPVLQRISAQPAVST